jgi:Na+/H+ antiporter NhaD/arsenite permease-like protein
VTPDAVFVLVVFAVVLVVVVFDWIDLTVAALLGVTALTVHGILTGAEVLKAIGLGGGALALVFGCMIVARTLVPTGIFTFVSDRFFVVIRGSGKRFLLGIVILVAPLCAVLPNATVVILLAPVVIRTARMLEIDFVPPLVLTALVSNAAGLLTLVGDPATFIVGTAINLSFTDYLQRVSLGGLLAILVLLPLLPLLFGAIWRTSREAAVAPPMSRIERPAFVILALAVLGVMVALFIFGESLPHPQPPPAVAILGASLALLVLFGARAEPMTAVFADIDFKSLLFIGCMFLIVQCLVKTGVLGHLSGALAEAAGDRLLLVAMLMLGGVALVSSFLANVPVVIAMVLVVKGYLVSVHVVPEDALGTTFTAWPETVLPLFVAMMFAGTLGGNATVIGASANVVAAGISAKNGQPIGFGRFLRFGLPITLAQLAVSAAYVLALDHILRG